MAYYQNGVIIRGSDSLTLKQPTYSMSNLITFEHACQIIKDAIDNNQYKLIYPYQSHLTYSFKFEKGARQFDPIDIIWMHVKQTSVPEKFSVMFNTLPMNNSDMLCLMQMSNGAWKKFDDIKPLKDYYDKRRIEFEQLTSIKVR